MSVSTAHTLIALLNALAALISGAASVVGLARPALALTAGEPLNSGVVLYARLYAARAVPLSAAVLILLAAGSWGSLGPVLIVAGLAQLADAAIGAARRNTGMLISASGLTVVHLASAQWLLSH
ncbi:hypothetical protein ITI46_14580 [Streptomyces oryzae]|uniref:DUF4267 domain-containing protein n=1 Tax=Streptomyces oryzae TaxID=1434886 RepID=A0ABS3XBZ7_9ACTN|nr:hypothetical protein [Streptomyces oryzae]MBO8192884.1 hypothetical protein [Streptomyces oryzae]